MTPTLWSGLLGLTPLLLYIVLVFRDVEILPATAPKPANPPSNPASTASLVF